MGPGDGVDDRQAEAGATAAPGLVGTGEALEGVVEELCGEAFARVAYPRVDGAVARRRTQAHGPGAVAEGVVHHVAERLLEAHRIGGQLGPWLGVDLQ